jgi:N6-L-threonylcarbamoyladenine synthase
MALILGIETSCDETAAAVVEDGVRIRSNVVASQIDIHSQYGGVFPEVASRIHVEAISAVARQAIGEANVRPGAGGDIDAIAVTQGPGLAGSLVVGVNFAKGLAFGWNKPLIGVNHIEGHIYSLWLTEGAEQIRFPVLVLVVSGGHTELLLMTDHGSYQMLGMTLDDAAGEAFACPIPVARQSSALHATAANQPTHSRGLCTMTRISTSAFQDSRRQSCASSNCRQPLASARAARSRWTPAT